MVTCDDVIVRTSKRRSTGGRKLFGFFVVVLLSCSLTATGASGVVSTTARPEVDGTTGAWQSDPEVEFLKRFLVAIIREAMRGSDSRDIVLEDQPDPESQLRTLMDKATLLRGSPDGKEEEEEDDDEEGEPGPGSTPRGPAAAEVKKSATEVFRDHKLKTLFRWGKRGSIVAAGV